MSGITEQAVASEAKDRAFFRSIPWTARLMDDAEFEYLPMISRIAKNDGEDTFLAETINTQVTVPHLISYYRKPTTPNSPVRETRTLMHLGTKLNGWNDVAHGGVQSFLLDEMMAFMLSSSKRVPGAKAVAPNTVTAELKVRFIKTMHTPSVLLGTAKLRDVQGRKLYAEANIVDENGAVLASADAIFIAIHPQHKQKMQKI